MKLYVWENVLRDYTPGMAVALAPNVAAARIAIQAKMHTSHERAEFDVPPTYIVDTAARKTPVAFAVHGGG